MIFNTYAANLNMDNFPKKLEDSRLRCITSISGAKRDIPFPRLLKDHSSKELADFYHKSWKVTHPKAPMKSFVAEILGLNFNPKAPCFITIDQFVKEPDPIEIIQGLETDLMSERKTNESLVLENQDLNEKITELSLEAGNTEVLVANLNAEIFELNAKIVAQDSVLSALKIISN